MSIKSVLRGACLPCLLVGTSAFAIVIVDGEKDGIFSGPEGYHGPLAIQKSNPIDFLDGPIVVGTFDSDMSNVGGKGGFDAGTTVSDPFPIMGEVGPGSVTTGIEYAIELDEIGFAAGPSEFIRIAGFLNNEFHDSVTNQVIGGFGAEQDALGEPRDINFNAFSGQQYVDVPPNGGPAMAATVDGVLDGHYPAALWTQTIGTSAGDNTDAGQHTANGSELNAIYAYVDETTDILYVFIAGNLSSDFRKFELFFDVRSGGQNRLRGDNSDVGFGGLNRMGDDGMNMNGVTFDTGFTADYWMSYTIGATNPDHYLDAAALGSLGGAPGGFVGGGNKLLGPISAPGPQNGGTLMVDCNNSNLGGVAGRSPQGGSGSESDVTDPATVTTGIEFVVNLAGINYDSMAPQDIKLCAFIVGQAWDFMSNQCVGGLTSGGDPDPGSLGFPAKDIDLNDWDGNQYVSLTVPGGLVNPGITIDGSLDAAAYGAAKWVNTTNGTSFGDNMDIDPDTGDGSEFDALYTRFGLRNGQPALYVFAAGNLHGWNRMLFFFDSSAGGQNDLRGDNAGIDGGRLNNGLGGPDGFTFDTGFDADYVIVYSTGDNQGVQDHFAEGAELLAGGGGNGGRIGEQLAKIDGPVSGNYEPRVGFGDNTDNTAAFANGNEIDAIYAKVEGANAFFLITGNLATDFTSMEVFFDTIPGQGQNTLLYDDPATPENEGNIKIDSGALDRMGGPVTYIDDTDPENPILVTLNDGLTFDTGFDPDVWVGIKTGNFDLGQANVYINYVKLRNGVDPGVGYFMGQGITGGLGALSGGDTGTPSAQLDINNSNTAGVIGAMNHYDGGGTNPATVTKGIEFSLPLTALGWNGTDEIKMAAFIAGEFHDIVSNQTAQHTCSDGLGEVRDIDFNDYQGLQYFTYNPATGMSSVAAPDVCTAPQPECEGDANGDLLVNFDDLN
ncbi:MAG: hypothetical protein KDA21_00195, partial [Phycisphaerales bacterium]|nr:hypothetical protein [Phycisphaerales bacterium]